MRWLGSATLAALSAATLAIGQANPKKQETDSTQAAATNRITGQCHCGLIKYEADGARAKFDECECRGCRRASGALKVQYVVVPPSALKITAGQPSEFRVKSAAKCDQAGVWGFCPTCGSPVFWKANKGDQIDIFAGTLADTHFYIPKN